MVEPLKTNQLWSIDGTFSVCPLPWKQFYTISILVDHHVVPIVYILLPSKTEIIYKKMLRVVTHLIPDLNPRIIICDFEKAAINAFKLFFPGSIISGCLFHLGQNIHKKVKSLGLASDYLNEPNTKKFVKAIICLSFIPFEFVKITFIWLREHERFPSKLRSLYEYFYILEELYLLS